MKQRIAGERRAPLPWPWILLLLVVAFAGRTVPEREPVNALFGSLAAVLAAVLPPGMSLSILVVDDNAVNQQVLTMMLERAGHRVHQAASGAEALELLDREKFDLVLMDVQMPGMDGLRATRLLRAREKAVGGRAPVVAVTANSGQGERERCLAAGMDDYLAKPVRGSELFATIGRLIGGPAGPSERPLPATAAAANTAAPAAGDWLESLRSLRLDRSAIVRLVQTFRDTAAERLERLRIAIKDDDAATLHAAAHTLKGSLAVFAARPAVETARRLEEMGREGRLKDARAALTELEMHMETLLTAMQAFQQNPS